MKTDQGVIMASLHIEHAITDINTWSTAFGRFADMRKQAGVRNERVQQPVDDDQYVLIDLDFDTTQEADAMLQFLRANVWASSETSPALAGAVTARVLESVDVA
jgi:hypothetical protein